MQVAAAAAVVSALVEVLEEAADCVSVVVRRSRTSTSCEWRPISSGTPRVSNVLNVVSSSMRIAPVLSAMEKRFAAEITSGQ